MVPTLVKIINLGIKEVTDKTMGLLHQAINHNPITPLVLHTVLLLKIITGNHMVHLVQLVPQEPMVLLAIIPLTMGIELSVLLLLKEMLLHSIIMKRVSILNKMTIIIMIINQSTNIILIHLHPCRKIQKTNGVERNWAIDAVPKPNISTCGTSRK